MSFSVWLSILLGAMVSSNIAVTTGVAIPSLSFQRREFPVSIFVGCVYTIVTFITGILYYACMRYLLIPANLQMLSILIVTVISSIFYMVALAVFKGKNKEYMLVVEQSYMELLLPLATIGSVLFLPVTVSWGVMLTICAGMGLGFFIVSILLSAIKSTVSSEMFQPWVKGLPFVLSVLCIIGLVFSSIIL